MRRLGEYIHSTKEGLIIVKTVLKDPRKIVGSIVYDKDMRRVGRIVDVIGRVDSPYVVVKPETKDILAVIEPGPLYYYVEKKHLRSRKRGWVKKKKR